MAFITLDPVMLHHTSRRCGSGAFTCAVTARPGSKRKLSTSQLRIFDAGRKLSPIGYGVAKCHHCVVTISYLGDGDIAI